MKAFRYQRIDNFDDFSPAWHVTHRKTEKYVGMVCRIGPNNFQVRRVQDARFNLNFGSRIEASRWLLEHLSSSAILDEDDPEDDVENSN
jgi:hypothetical protein